MVWNPFKRSSTAQKSKASGRHPRRRNFGAAEVNRLTSGWTTSVLSADDLITKTWRVLVARSRQQHQANDYMIRFIGLLQSHVVGPKGFVLQAMAKDSQGHLDTLDNEAIEKSFARWSKKGVCDTTGTYSRRALEKMFITTVAVDGEFIAREHRLGEFGYQLQMVDPFALPIDHCREDLSNGNYIKFSIEYTRADKPVAYHFLVDPKGGGYPFNGRHYERVPAEEVLHCFLPMMIRQKRGLPMASTALMRMNQLDGYQDAAVVAARYGASKMGFFTRPVDSDYVGDGKDEDGVTIQEVEPGILEELPAGFEFTSFNPDYPHQQFGDFVKACLRGIASGLNVNYNTLANDLEGVNFSSIRTGVLEDREVWKALQEWMIESLSEPVYLHWLLASLKLMLLVNAAGVRLPTSKLEKYSEHRWQGRRWAWVDPLKDISAHAMAIKLNITSVSKVIREQGEDPDTMFKEIAAERTQMRDLGIPIEHLLEIAASIEVTDNAGSSNE